MRKGDLSYIEHMSTESEIIPSRVEALLRIQDLGDTLTLCYKIRVKIADLWTY